MKHLERSGNQKKKTHFVGLFFLTGLRPVLRLRRSTPSARCAFGAPPPNWIALAHRPTSHSRLDRHCAYPRIALIRQTDRQTIWMIDRTGSGNVGLTHFLMKHLGEVGTRKKRPASRVFFFLPAFGRCCPLVSDCPVNFSHMET